MKFTIEVDPEKTPDAVGEFLRDAFFDQHQDEDGWSIGCYSVFDWRPGVHPLPDLPVEPVEHNHPEDQEPAELCWGCSSEDMKWTRGAKSFALPELYTIECRWYWDGDGTLAFSLPGNRWLVNTDCKKDHGWTLLAEGEEPE